MASTTYVPPHLRPKRHSSCEKSIDSDISTQSTDGFAISYSEAASIESPNEGTNTGNDGLTHTSDSNYHHNTEGVNLEMHCDGCRGLKNTITNLENQMQIAVQLFDAMNNQIAEGNSVQKSILERLNCLEGQSRVASALQSNAKITNRLAKPQDDPRNSVVASQLGDSRAPNNQEFLENNIGQVTFGQENAATTASQGQAAAGI